MTEPTLVLHSRAVPSVDAHHHISGPNTERNSGGRRIKKTYGGTTETFEWLKLQALIILVRN